MKISDVKDCIPLTDGLFLIINENQFFVINQNIEIVLKIQNKVETLDFSYDTEFYFTKAIINNGKIYCASVQKLYQLVFK